MDTKLKSINWKNRNFIIYGVILLLTSTIILSALEIRENFSLLNPNQLYTRTDLMNVIENFTQEAIDFSVYYKSEAYVKDEKNITSNDIDICKEEIKDKVNLEVDDLTNKLYHSSSFNQLSDGEREKKLDSEIKAIEEKYKLSDEKLKEYILQRKISSYNSLNNELNSYVNLKFSAYDETSKKWIVNEQNDLNILKNDSRFFQQINLKANGNIYKNVYVNGKVLKEKTYNRFYSYDYSNRYYNNKEITVSDENYGGNDSSINHDITLYVWIPQQIQSGDTFYITWRDINNNRNILFTVTIILLVSSLTLLALIYTIKNKKINKIEIDKIIDKIDQYPFEYKIGVAILAWIVYLSIRNIHWYVGYTRILKVTNILYLSVLITIWYLTFKALYKGYKDGTLLKNNISKKLKIEFSTLMKNGSIFRSILLMILAYGVIGGALLFMAIIAHDLFLFFLVVGIVVTIAFIVIGMKKIAYLEKIMEGAKDGAEGKLTYKIEEKGQGRFTDLAHNINNIKEGLRESIQKEVKSEKMKTELITNVSHDLKTPLTSIINYIDLLKRENIEPEEARDYVRVLDMKAQRLKILIEDLFEASKAASGAMELNIEKIEVIQLIKQVLGENDERIKEHGLELRINIPEEKVFIQGDGKRLYRVFENIISNAIKYSLANTRVYIDVVKEENDVKITMKNIAAYELKFDVDEITERFKRADEARASEGSGLGLAIAKSIVELHGGKFYVEIDGDLFKVIITLK